MPTRGKTQSYQLCWVETLCLFKCMQVCAWHSGRNDCKYLLWAITVKVIRPDLPDFLLLKLSRSKFWKKKCKFVSWFMHKCKRSQCAVWVENSVENIRELNIDEQFSETRVKKWTPKTTSIATKCSLTFLNFFFTGHLDLLCDQASLSYRKSSGYGLTRVQCSRARGQEEQALWWSCLQRAGGVRNATCEVTQKGGKEGTSEGGIA